MTKTNHKGFNGIFSLQKIPPDLKKNDVDLHVDCPNLSDSITKIVTLFLRSNRVVFELS